MLFAKHSTVLALGGALGLIRRKYEDRRHVDRRASPLAILDDFGGTSHPPPSPPSIDCMPWQDHQKALAVAYQKYSMLDPVAGKPSFGLEEWKVNINICLKCRMGWTELSDRWPSPF